tara:strand:- start:493 stop:1017 length:525 start_codon:yes stop_codon:yes gene_type:complete
MVHISRLFLVVLTFISFLSSSQEVSNDHPHLNDSGELDGKYLICDSGDWKFWTYDERFLGITFVKGHVILHKVVRGEEGKAEYAIKEDIGDKKSRVDDYEYIVKDSYVTWHAQHPYSLNRRTLGLAQNDKRGSLGVKNGYDCEVVEEKDYFPGLEKYGELLVEEIKTKLSQNKI